MIPPALLAILVLPWLAALGAGPVSAQESQDPRIVKILDRAEILEAGEWREIKTGERLALGRTLRASKGAQVEGTAAGGDGQT